MATEIKTITIYYINDCPYCNGALDILNKLFRKNNKIKYEKINLSNNKDIQIIKNKYNHRTVPIILINNKLIGGLTELKKILHIAI